MRVDFKDCEGFFCGDELNDTAARDGVSDLRKLVFENPVSGEPSISGHSELVIEAYELRMARAVEA